jgi:RNA polymerase sigma factor (sigma-70 family)
MMLQQEPGSASMLALPVPDHELARRWQAGDQASAGMLVDRHLPRLRAFLAARCGNATEADDLAQEVFLAVCRQIATYRADLLFSAWLYGIARNKLADYWRQRRPTDPFNSAHEAIDYRSPARLHEESDAGAKAWAEVFKGLPEAQATALWLRVQEEFSMEAIAQALDVTLGNAKVLLFRARQTMAAHWKTRTIIS